MNNLISICYHDVIDTNRKSDISGFNTKGSNNYSVNLSLFRDQMKILSNENVILINQINTISAKKNIILTFDDAGVSCYNNILPVLEEHNLKAHFFIPTNFIGNEFFLNEMQIREICNLGHMIGSHSSSHPIKISNLKNHDQFLEWKYSINKLEDITGEKIDCASIPNGDSSRAVYDSMIRNGINYIFTSTPITGINKYKSAKIIGRFTIRNIHNNNILISILNKEFITLFRFLISEKLKKLFQTIFGKKYLSIRKLILRF